MPNDQSLKRIFASSKANKYVTVGKFLAPKVSPQPSDPQVNQASNIQLETSTEAIPQPDAELADLNLLDNLVEQSLLNHQLSDQNAQYNPAPARAKESLPVSFDQNLSQEPTTVETSAENHESISNPELQELSQEIQEVSKETKEQREQALIKEKQQAINDLAAASSIPVAVNDQPVVVLPITAASKEEAKFKTTAYSVKWLWEWCKKVSKIFAGAVVYKEEVEQA